MEFSEISGLEINEGKTKIIRIGTRLDDLVPTVAFKYAQKFTLLGVEIDNKLKKLDENFKERAKKIETKIILWRKYNLSTVGNLSISKTFLISQLGYLLSMLECPVDLLESMQESINKFITRSNNSLIVKTRIYNKPKESKVMNPINICYLESKDIHKMHVGIRHVIESFEEVHKAYKDQKDDNITMYTPIDHLSIIRTNGPRIRNNGTRMGKPTQLNVPYLFNSKG